MENNPGPAVLNNTNPTTTVSAGHNSRNPKHTLVNAGKQCTMFCNYVYIYTYTCLYIHLFVVKIYNQIEDAVHRICLLVPQDGATRYKKVYLPFTVTVTLN